MNILNSKNLITIGKILLLLIIYITGLVLVQSLWDIFSIDNISTPVQIILYGLIEFLTGILILYSFLYFDKRNWDSIGFSFKHHAREFVTGAFIGFFIISIGTAIILIFDTVQMQFLPIRASYLVASFIMLVFSVIGEEMFFRGYILNNLLKISNQNIAIIISSLFFTFFHLLNPELSFLSVTNIFLAGLFLALAYIVTRNLWFAIGIHLFWNFAQSLYGYNVSGVGIGSVFSLEYKEENFLNGGSFGFEGSCICTIFLFIFILFLFIKSKAVVKEK